MWCGITSPSDKEFNMLVGREHQQTLPMSNNNVSLDDCCLLLFAIFLEIHYQNIDCVVCVSDLVLGNLNKKNHIPWTYSVVSVFTQTSQLVPSNHPSRIQFLTFSFDPNLCDLKMKGVTKATSIAACTIIIVFVSSWSSEAARIDHGKIADIEIDEYLAGFVVFRQSGNVNEYLLLKKAKGDKEWQPAKGHVEDDDVSTYAAAIREVEEETGLIRFDYQTIEHHLMHHYVAGDGTSKQVDMWPARVFNGNKPIILGAEHSEYLWANIYKVVELVNKRWRNNVFLPADEFLSSYN